MARMWAYHSVCWTWVVLSALCSVGSKDVSKAVSMVVHGVDWRVVSLDKRTAASRESYWAAQMAA